MLSTARLHLAEYQATLPVPRLTAAQEVTRVREHLLGAIEMVGSAPTDALTPAQKARRTLLLGQLIRYAVAGRFPKNIDLPDGMEPTFVDHEGTRCAMAHLIDETGGQKLVDRVAATANHAYVRELAADGELVEWLVAHGLSVDEAGRIQPGYCGSPALECVCELSFADAADLIAGVVQGDGRLLVDEVFQSESGLAVGDVLEVTYNAGPFEEGERVFADYADGAHLHYAFADADTIATSSCASFPGTPPDTLDVAVILDIVNGAECVATLQAADPNWVDESECEEGGLGGGSGEGGGLGEGGGGGEQSVGGGASAEDGGSSSGGCSFASLPSHDAALLMALMAGLAVVRSRRRARAI
ncbi:MAG: hypothetical protein JNK04_17525 [Myxococcales bacterium]|nr:hypothetical protein [Myxococcales bacterium]